MGNIIGETECISSRYSNEYEEFEMRWREEIEREKNWASFNAMHLIKNKEKETNKVWQ